MKTINLATPPPATELSNSAARALRKLLQRSTDDLALLKLIHTKVMNMLDHETSCLLPISTCQYDPVPKTQTALLLDTGALLTMPKDFAQLVLRRIEGRMHKLSREDMSDVQWKKVETLSARLATQHPDHVTNVIRLWQQVIKITGEQSQDTILKDPGVLLQHRDDEIVIIMDRFGVSVGAFKGKDEEPIVIQDDDEDDWETEAE